MLLARFVRFRADPPTASPLAAFRLPSEAPGDCVPSRATMTRYIRACDPSCSDDQPARVTKVCRRWPGRRPISTPTFASIQADIFETSDRPGRVPASSCHTKPAAIAFVGGLNLSTRSHTTSWSTCRARRKPGAIRVIPGNPENSYLVQKVEGRPGIVGLRMPQQRPTVPHQRPDPDSQALDRNRRAQRLSDVCSRQGDHVTRSSIRLALVLGIALLSAPAAFAQETTIRPCSTSRSRTSRS